MSKNKISVAITLIFIFQTIFAGRFWVWNLLSFVPPIFFTLLFLFLIFYNIAKGNKYGIAFVVICFPMAMYFSDISFKLFVDQSSLNSQTVSVFNWNTEFWQTDNKQEFYNFLLAK